MWDHQFTASVQVAIDWVNRYLVYGSSTADDVPQPKIMHTIWFDAIKADPVTVSRQDGDIHEDVTRNVRFYVRDTLVATIRVTGYRYSHRSGRTYTNWAVEHAEYRNIWPGSEDSNVLHVVDVAIEHWRESSAG